MQKRKRFIPHLLISFLALIGIILFVNTFDPKDIFDISVLKFPIIIPLFFLVFLIIGGVTIFLLASIRRGILLALFVVCFLFLQYLHSNSILNTAILILIVILIEFLFWKKK